MNGWVAKRFWSSVDVVDTGDGFGVSLDGRPVRTPSKLPLICPTAEMAEKIAGEWSAVDEVIDPAVMPWTRSANSAIDKVRTQRHEVERHLAGYAATDLLCYRAEGPQTLIDRQALRWDPLIAWASDSFGVTFNVTTGVMPVDQPEETIRHIGSVMLPMSDFELTGFHDLVTLSGSFVIALATLAGRDSPEGLWNASRVDEEFQIEQWGEDEEASEHAKLRKLAFLHAADFFNHAKKTDSINGLRL